MKKIFLVLLVVLFVVGCGGGDQTKKENAASEITKQKSEDAFEFLGFTSNMKEKEVAAQWKYLWEKTFFKVNDDEYKKYFQYDQDGYVKEFTISLFYLGIIYNKFYGIDSGNATTIRQVKIDMYYAYNDQRWRREEYSVERLDIKNASIYIDPIIGTKVIVKWR